MSKVSTSVYHHRKVKKIRKAAKGYRGRRSKLYRTAKNAVMVALRYAYRDRRNKKRVLRSLWISRVNAALRMHGLTYSQFINKANKANIIIDRKVFSSLFSAPNRSDIIKNLAAKF